MPWNFDNTYATLPNALFTTVNPETVAAPRLVLYNDALAQKIGLSATAWTTDEKSAFFSGNQIPEGAQPLAQAYAGHQFGNFTMLGDGRAILLGEHLTPDTERIDIQLKGAGKTLYSRRGDGRATLYAMLREYLISEAMHYLGISTSRSLAVVASGEKVFREFVHEGAILTRTAESHIRVGTFEYVAQFQPQLLSTFTDYTIKRHYPELIHEPNPALALLQAVTLRQIDLIVQWMRVGFIHGVMNTDNMSIAGETIDYGPCAFMNNYDPQTVFSAIDHSGRYAFGNQPIIMQWNLARLASALLPLIDENQDKAIEKAQAWIYAIPDLYEAAYYDMMRKKIGITDAQPEDKSLIDNLLQIMTTHKADYTNTFLYLQDTPLKDTMAMIQSADFGQWKSAWETRLGGQIGQAKNTMQTQNPLVIPRNQIVEKALGALAYNNDITYFDSLLTVLRAPYTFNEKYQKYMEAPNSDAGYQTFCGT